MVFWCLHFSSAFKIRVFLARYFEVLSVSIFQLVFQRYSVTLSAVL
jgi:hypothetical protein